MAQPGTEGEPGGPSGVRTRAALVGAFTAVVVFVVGMMVISAGDDRPEAVRPSDPASAGPSVSPSPSPEVLRVRPIAELKAEPGLNGVVLRWKRPKEGAPVDHYEVFRDGKRVGRTHDRTFMVDGLTIGTRYRLWVVSVTSDDRTSKRTLTTATTRVPPASEARLEGAFTVTASLGQHDAARVRFSSHSIAWSFTPLCGQGPCDVSWRATSRTGGTSVITSGTLAFSGGSYSGTWRGFYVTSCRAPRDTALSTITITVRVTGGRAVEGRWIATGLSGAISESVEGCGGVPRASYTF